MKRKIEKMQRNQIRIIKWVRSGPRTADPRVLSRFRSNLALVFQVIASRLHTWMEIRSVTAHGNSKNGGSIPVLLTTQGYARCNDSVKALWGSLDLSGRTFTESFHTGADDRNSKMKACGMACKATKIAETCWILSFEVSCKYNRKRAFKEPLRVSSSNANFFRYSKYSY